jgi:hypothetical protein
MTRFLAAALFVLVATPAMAQDVYVKTRAHSDAFAIADQSRPARDDVFAPPAGYTKQATLSIQDLQRR